MFKPLRVLNGALRGPLRGGLRRLNILEGKPNVIL